MNISLENTTDSGLGGYWKFDETSGSIAYDSSSYNNNGTLSGSLLFITSDAPLNETLSAPTNVSASDGTYSDRVQITWNNSTGASHYHVYRSISNNGTYLSIGDWQAETMYNDYSASAGLTYYYKISAANSDSGTNQSGYSLYNSGWRGIVLSPPVPGNAINFPSADSDNYIEITHNNSLSGNSFTLEAWIKMDSYGTQYDRRMILSKGDYGEYSAVDYNYFLFVDQGYPKVLYEYNSSGSNEVIAESSTPLNLNEWYHIAAVRNNTDSSLKLFVDGVLK